MTATKTKKTRTRPKPTNGQPLRLDLGSGPNKQAGFHGVDAIAFPGVDTVCDLTKKWPWHGESVEEVYCSHFVEHLERLERVHFFNELYRVLVMGGTAKIVVPDWSSQRAYGDMDHKWPPVSEFFWNYLRRDWRLKSAPHTDAKFRPGWFNCNFVATGGFNVCEEVGLRCDEYQRFAKQFYKDACTDSVTVLTKVK